MDKEEMEYLTRSQENTRTKRRKEHKMNRTLNYMIALVSALLVISLAVIFLTGDEEEAEGQPEAEDTSLESENPHAVEDADDETEVDQSAPDHGKTDDQSTEDDRTVDINEDTAVINASDDPLVAEVWTSDAWQSYPTAQTGEHQSTFTVGHIDYEEKLQSIFSVVPIEQQQSIIWSVKNNGNAKSAIAVISSNDKTQNYRVAIEWVDQQGWKPVKVEVLNTLDGAY